LTGGGQGCCPSRTSETYRARRRARPAPARSPRADGPCPITTYRSPCPSCRSPCPRTGRRRRACRPGSGREVTAQRPCPGSRAAWGLRGEHLDSLVLVPAGGGLRDPEPLAQPPDVRPVPEPGQREDRLLPAGQGRGSDLAAVLCRRARHEHHELERDVKDDPIGQPMIYMKISSISTFAVFQCRDERGQLAVLGPT
jgi:hypothetical protein